MNVAVGKGLSGSYSVGKFPLSFHSFIFKFLHFTDD